MLEQDLSGAGSAVSGYELIDPSSADLTPPPSGNAAVGLIDSFAGQG